MVKYIEFGKYNKNYDFLFLAAALNISISYIPKFFKSVLFNYNIISIIVDELFKHLYISRIFFSFFMLVFSCILNKYENKLSEYNLDKSDDSNLDKGCFKNIRISEVKKGKLNNRKNLLNISIIIIICYFLEDLNGVISALTVNFRMSMIILLILSYINTKIFKIKIYKHQKCAILFNFFVLFMISLITFILSIKSQNDQNIYKNYYKLIPVGVIFYFFDVITISYSYSKIKWFMNLNLFSLSKILIIFAITGIAFNTIICVLFTFINCGEKKISFCKIYDGHYYYFENFKVFYQTLLAICRDENNLNIIFVIIHFVFLSFIIFLSNFFSFSALKNLYPEHIFFTNPIKETITNIIFIFYNRILYGYFFGKDEDKMPVIKFILDIVGNCLIIVGFLIYLEIIELNFCGCNYNLRKNIIHRAIKDIQEIDDDSEQDESLIDDNNSNKKTELSIKEQKK